MGVPLVTVQRILRHKDVRLTASTYGHLSIEDMREGLARNPLGSLDALVPSARRRGTSPRPTGELHVEHDRPRDPSRPPGRSVALGAGWAALVGHEEKGR
jgi:hypothetical protein